MDVWLCVLQRNARGMDLRSALCLLVSACWLGCAQMWFLLLLTHCDQWHSHLWKAQCSLLDRICHVMVCSQNAAALKYVLGLHWIQFLWVILPVSCLTYLSMAVPVTTEPRKLPVFCLDVLYRVFFTLILYWKLSVGCDILVGILLPLLVVRLFWLPLNNNWFGVLGFRIPNYSSAHVWLHAC